MISKSSVVSPDIFRTATISEVSTSTARISMRRLPTMSVACPVRTYCAPRSRADLDGARFVDPSGKGQILLTQHLVQLLALDDLHSITLAELGDEHGRNGLAQRHGSAAVTHHETREIQNGHGGEVLGVD